MEDVIVYVLPVFGALMALELGLGLVRGRNTYGFADTLANLSQGLLSQVVAACTQLIQVGLYALAFPHLTLTPHAAPWGHWEGAALAVLLYDFCDYWLHRVSHESAIFWAAHVVHHQSRHFNLSTALRQESAYNLSGWMFFLPMALVGVPPAQFAFAGVVVLFYQFWIHTEHIGSLGVLDRIFSTPSNHRVHHATNPRYIDRNYGAILVVWDRMFGSFEPESEACVYGTTTPLVGWDPLRAAGGPYVDLARRVGRVRGWDRVRVMFKGPGWEPGEGSASLSAQPAFAPGPDASSSPIRRAAAVALFLLATAQTAALLWLGDALGAWPTGAVALCVAGGLWAVGALLDARRPGWIPLAVGCAAAAMTGVLLGIA